MRGSRFFNGQVSEAGMQQMGYGQEGMGHASMLYPPVQPAMGMSMPMPGGIMAGMGPMHPMAMQAQLMGSGSMVMNPMHGLMMMPNGMMGAMMPAQRRKNFNKQSGSKAARRAMAGYSMLYPMAMPGMHPGMAMPGMFHPGMMQGMPGYPQFEAQQEQQEDEDMQNDQEEEEQDEEEPEQEAPQHSGRAPTRDKDTLVNMYSTQYDQRVARQEQKRVKLPAAMPAPGRATPALGAAAQPARPGQRVAASAGTSSRTLQPAAPAQVEEAAPVIVPTRPRSARPVLSRSRCPQFLPFLAPSPTKPSLKRPAPQSDSAASVPASQLAPPQAQLQAAEAVRQGTRPPATRQPAVQDSAPAASTKSHPALATAWVTAQTAAAASGKSPSKLPHGLTIDDLQYLLVEGARQRAMKAERKARKHDGDGGMPTAADHPSPVPEPAKVMSRPRLPADAVAHPLIKQLIAAREEAEAKQQSRDQRILALTEHQATLPRPMSDTPALGRTAPVVPTVSIPAPGQIVPVLPAVIPHAQHVAPGSGRVEAARGKMPSEAGVAVVASIRPQVDPSRPQQIWKFGGIVTAKELEQGTGKAAGKAAGKTAGKVAGKVAGKAKGTSKVVQLPPVIIKKQLRKPMVKAQLKGAMQPMLFHEVQEQPDGRLVVKASCPFGEFQGSLSLSGGVP